MTSKRNQVYLEPSLDSRTRVPTSDTVADTGTTGFDSHSDVAHSDPLGADGMFARSPLSVQGIGDPVLQRAQRAYGNRASQRMVARKSTNQSETAGVAIPNDGGQALDSATRRTFEAHFQSDFSDVRVHTDSEAADSAEQLDAAAYTTGRDVYFASGMYSPTSSSGRRLLAHEVAHVVQQSSGKEPAIAMESAHGAKVGAPGDILELEAVRQADEFMDGRSPTAVTEEKHKEHGFSTIRLAHHEVVQRQQPSAQSTTSPDATAQSIIRGAGDTSRDAGARAVEAVWRIIHEYFSGRADRVNSVTYDDAQAGTGLATGPHPANHPTSGRILVGDDFLKGVQNVRNFAHHVLQVGHELEHIEQFLDPGLGPPAAKKDEREFLAYYHEALAAEVPHTGRFQHSTRIAVIDQALGYYNCLTSATQKDKQDAAKKYASYQQQLLTRRSAEIADMTNKGYTNVPTNPPPSGCIRQL